MGRDPTEAIDLNTLAVANFNIFASYLMIRVWQKLGISHYFVSPGYRDAPFLAALRACPEVEVSSLYDERAAAYQALGFAKATRRPAVLVCTSGTAGANYYPAVIEASVDHVPLLVVTSDRPFELVFAGAQQVIDQRQLYGRHSKKSFDLPAPSESLSVRAWVSYAREAALASQSVPAGPVHLNLPFQTPLDPVREEHPLLSIKKEELEILLGDLATGEVGATTRHLTAAGKTHLQASLAKAERGLLVLGRLSSKEEQAAARTFAERLGWPVYADVGSGCKGRVPGELLDIQHPSARAALDDYRPDCVVHLGRRLISRLFDEALSRWNPRDYWVVSDEVGVQDPSHRAQRIQVAIDTIALLDLELPIARTVSPSAQELIAFHQTLRRKLAEGRWSEFCFADVARTISEIAPLAGTDVFLGNSTAIRAFDSWIFDAKAWPSFEANRGVSGIEGLLSTTIGLAKGSRRPWTAVLGDISLLYDLNAVLSLAQESVQVVLVVVNNQGGRIFEMLPLSKYPWLKDPYVTTPHNFSFAGIAEMAHLPYVLCEDDKSFRHSYQTAVQKGGPCLIECRQGPDVDARYSSFLKTLMLPSKFHTPPAEVP